MERGRERQRERGDRSTPAWQATRGAWPGDDRPQGTEDAQHPEKQRDASTRASRTDGQQPVRSMSRAYLYGIAEG